MKTILKQRQIRRWKLRNLGAKQRGPLPLVADSRQPVFGANVDAKELNDFVKRLRQRS